MANLITFVVSIIAILHLWFCVLEMFLWQKPLGLKIFKLDIATARLSAPLGANQGLYNLFLSAGLLWSLLANDFSFAFQLKIFFLSCVTIAGIYAGITVNHRIFWVQAFPAILVLALLYVF